MLPWIAKESAGTVAVSRRSSEEVDVEDVVAGSCFAAVAEMENRGIG